MIYKNHKTYKKHTWLPLQVIEQAIAENWLESLSYFVRLKSFHHRPVFYNYSLRKLSAYLKCSPSTIAKHISILSKMGLCELIGADLHLKSNNSLRKQDKFIVPVGIDLNKANQRTLLRQCLIKRNLHLQFKTFSKKSDALKFLHQRVKGMPDLRKCKKAASYFPDQTQLENSVQTVLTLSNKRFGELCNRSQSTGIKIQKQLNKLKLLTSLRRTEIVSEQPIDRRSFFELGLNGSYFLSNRGIVMQRLSNEIKLVGGKGEKKVLFH